MPILDVEKAKTVPVRQALASARAMRASTTRCSTSDGTMMLLGDAKKMTEDIVKAMDD
ncbi:MAG: hypothetical protein ACN6I5_03925 [Hyphomicrobiales bacterium]